ncbi:hypothetical protein VTK56DRAFT_10181 [Thermocarpiscus australiensis]
MMKRNLLVCFDAFGTLIKARRPIPEQYAIVARQCGLNRFTIEQLEASFRAAFKGESREHPNYGRASGMGAEKWWTNVIHKTFQPFTGPGSELPKDLAPRLLHRFSSGEGYTLAPGAKELLQSLKQQQQASPANSQRSDQIIVGVITNSDDRIPGILSSLGLRVSPLRFGSRGIDATAAAAAARDQQYDIDFHCMSYDVGFTKPDRRIFEAAESMANELVATQNGVGSGQHSERAKEHAPLSSWLKLYVGDELETDMRGAMRAGWNAVLVNPGEVSGGEFLELVQCGQTAPEDLFPQDGMPPLAVRADSIKGVLEWLVNHYTKGRPGTPGHPSVPFS